MVETNIYSKLHNGFRWKAQFPEDKFLSALTDQYLTASQIAKKIGCGNSLATKRLRELVQNNKIEGFLVHSGRGVWLYRLKRSDGNTHNTL